MPISISMDECARQRELESHFLRQLEGRARKLLRSVPAAGLDVMSMPDGADAVRAELRRLDAHDRTLLDKLPGIRSLQLRFRESWWNVLRGRTGQRIRAQMLTQVEALVSGGEPGEVGREEVLDALARYEVMPARTRPSVVVFCSATGFSEAALAMAHHEGPPGVVLVGAREDGGWDVRMPAALRRGPWAELFEFETADDLLRRLQYHLDRSVDELESRGLSVLDLAERLGTSLEKAESLVRRACRADPRLLTVVHDGVIHVCRSPLAEEGHRMSVWSRIRKLLRLKPTMAERVRELTETRVKLEQQRLVVDRKIEALEKQERDALAQGAAAKADAEKKQIAGKLMRARKELSRNRAQAQMYTNQIDVIGTHIHHMTLKEQGKRVALPKAEDLTREAAEAEQIMSELAANADLASSIEVGVASPMMEAEEADILKEFEQLAAAQSGPARETPDAQKSSEKDAGPEPTARETASSGGERSRGGERGAAKPELG